MSAGRGGSARADDEGGIKNLRVGRMAEVSGRFTTELVLSLFLSSGKVRLTRDPSLILQVLHTAGGVVKCNNNGVAIRFEEKGDAKEQNEGDRDWFRLQNHFKEAEGCPQRLEAALENAMEWTRLVGGSTMEMMGNTVRQGVIDLAGLDVADPETGSMLFAVTTLIEVLLAKFNLSDLGKLTVLGCVLAREFTLQEPEGALCEVFCRAVDKFQGNGHGFGSEPWYEAGMAVVQREDEQGIVPAQELFRSIPRLVADLAQELEERTEAEIQSRTEMEQLKDAYVDAMHQWQDAKEEWVRKKALMRQVSNELGLVQKKRRRTRERCT